ncbi:hypothetical protein FRC00_005807, partial [Tulasnella sp. 408]
MSRKNAPSVPGGFSLTGVFSNLAGLSETETPPEKSGGHAAGKNATEPPKRKGNGHAAAAASSGNPTETSAVPGLAELVEVVAAMAAAPLGARPKLNQDLIEKINNSPLHPVLKELQPVYKKLGPLVGSPEHLQAQAQAHAQAQAAHRTEAHTTTAQPESAPGPGPSSANPQPSQPASTPTSGPSSTQQSPSTPAALDIAELKRMEAALRSMSAKLDSVSQAVAREAVKASGTATKTQIETVDRKVTQMADKFDPALAELKVGVKRLQVSLLDDARADKTRLETRVKELENENKELQRVIRDTNAELLPVEVASQIALQGTFTDGPDADKPGTGKPGAGKPGARGSSDSAVPSLLQTARKVRNNTLVLAAKCRALFTFINRDRDTDKLESDLPDLGKDGEWGRCAEHLRVSHSKLRNAVEEKEETAQKLQFVGFVIDQIRKGHYIEKEWENDINWKNFADLVEKSPDGFSSIRLLADDLSRHITEATTPAVSNDLTSPTASAVSNTSTAKPISSTPQAPAAHVESVAPVASTPAVTALSSPAVANVPLPTREDGDTRNAPNGFGGYMSGFGFGNFGGASEPEPLQARDRAHGHAAGAAAANKSATQHPKEKANGNTAANAASTANRNPPEQPVIPGLAELVEVMNAMAAAPLGARPRINPELIDKIKNSPLHPVLGGLQPVFKKLGPLEGSPEHQQAQAQAEAAQRAGAHPSTPQPESAPGPGPSSVQPQSSQLASTPESDPSSVPIPAALDVAELKRMEAALSSLSSKLDFVSHAVTDVTTRTEMGGNFQMLENNLRQADSETREAVREAVRETVKASANAAKTQVENVDKKVAQMTDKLDPVLAELTQGVKKLQISLRDDAKVERARFEARVKELEKEVKDLQQVIDDTRAELLPVEAASKIALQGSLSDEPDKKGSRGGNDNTTPNLLQTAKKVRAN